MTIKLNPSSMSDYECLIRMIRAETLEERFDAMGELTNRIRQGKVKRDIRLIKARLQLLNLKKCELEEREEAAQKAIKDFALEIQI